MAFRLNGVFEDSGSFRRYVNLRRFAFNPTLTITPGKRTRITLGYEHLRDDRVADRGIPSFQGKPADVDITTYYGNPNDTHVGARVNIGSALFEYQIGQLNIRNRTLIADYDRGYQNFVPGAMTADMSLVALTAYNNATRRRNGFNETDVTYIVRTGRIRHTLLAEVKPDANLPIISEIPAISTTRQRPFPSRTIARRSVRQLLTGRARRMPTIISKLALAQLISRIRSSCPVMFK